MTSEELRAALIKLGWSQVRLARRLGVAPDTVIRWTNGRTPTPQYVAEYLRVVNLAIGRVSGI